jgi:adenylate cyclase
MTEGVVLFADLQMDPLYDSLGEQAARALIGDALKILDEGIRAGAGRVVKKIGDQVMAVFPDAAEAAIAAIAMQRGVAALAHAKSRESRLRVGFAWGPFVEQADGDLFGDTVSHASSTLSRRRNGKIVLTGDAASRLPPAQRAKCSLIYTLELKGKGGSIEYFELPWE